MPSISVDHDTCFFHQTDNVTSAETSSTTNFYWLSREMMVSIAIMLFQLPFYSKISLFL